MGRSKPVVRLATSRIETRNNAGVRYLGPKMIQIVGQIGGGQDRGVSDSQAAETLVCWAASHRHRVIFCFVVRLDPATIVRHQRVDALSQQFLASRGRRPGAHRCLQGHRRAPRGASPSGEDTVAAETGPLGRPSGDSIPRSLRFAVAGRELTQVPISGSTTAGPKRHQARCGLEPIVRPTASA